MRFAQRRTPDQAGPVPIQGLARARDREQAAGAVDGGLWGQGGVPQGRDANTVDVKDDVSHVGVEGEAVPKGDGGGGVPGGDLAGEVCHPGLG